MLKQPFSGKELFIQYTIRMIPSVNELMASYEWENVIGKTKKQTWNTLAERINERMEQEKSDDSSR